MIYEGHEDDFSVSFVCLVDFGGVMTMDAKVSVLAGMVSTVLFAASLLPMLRKAWQTKDLRSYSLDSLLLTNVANVVHSVYVFDLPPGPIWFLHAFYLLASIVLLGLYMRHEWWPMCGRLARWLLNRAMQVFPSTSTEPVS
jgi:hypothetical protein